MDLHAEVLRSATDEFRKLKGMAERAMAQLKDDDFFICLNEDQNSIYVIVKHIAGNMRSRWTDFLTSDGEKSDRNRDQEFAEQTAAIPRQQIMQLWEDGWACLFSALSSLRDGDLLATISIRHEKMSAIAAINRQISHYAYHVGQIVLLAKHLVGPANWQYLTIPRGRSQQFNQQMQDKAR